MRGRVLSPFIIFCLAALFLFSQFFSSEAYAQRRLRVGFFHFDGYHMEDEQGNRSGYGYEYLQHMLLYADWKYEYVGYDKSWSEMLGMLERGEIDILTSAQKTKDREKRFGFSKNSIGKSKTIVTVKSGNTRYMSGDWRKWSGIRVGMLKNNSRNESFAAFAREKDFSYVPVYFNDMQKMLRELQEGGSIDAVVTSNLRATSSEWVVAEFSPSPFYIITRKEDFALLHEIDDVLSKLQADDVTLEESLMDKFYTPKNGSELPFTVEERKYIENARRSGRRFKAMLNPEWEPFSYRDEQGRPAGAFVEIGKLIAARSGLEFEFITTANREEHLKKKESREADIILDLRCDYNMAEKRGYRLTNPYIHLNVTKLSLKNNHGDMKTVAALRFSNITEQFIKTYFHEKDIVFYDTQQECVDAVLAGRQDCLFLYAGGAQLVMNRDITNSLLANVIYGWKTYYGVGVTYREPPLLASIMDKSMRGLEEREVNDILAKYTAFPHEDLSLKAFLYGNPLFAVGGIFVLSMLAIILVLYLTTRRRRAEALARGRELERFITYVCGANDVVGEVDVSNGTRVLYGVSDGRVMQQTESYSLEKDLLPHIHPDDCERVGALLGAASLGRLVDEGGALYFECRMKNGGGQYEWFSYTVLAMNRESVSRTGFMFFIRCIEEAKRREDMSRRALVDALESARNASNSKSSFLSRMSHDIRTPLNAIIGFTAIARESLSSAAEDRNKALGCLEKTELASRHLLTILNEVLDMASIESGRVKIADVPFDLSGLLSSLESIFSTQARGNGVAFSVEAKDVAGLRLTGDSMRLDQILMNLLSNAVKFTEKDGRVALTAEVVAVKENKVYIRFTVADTGIGIAPEFLEHIFEPFEQQDNSIARQYGGTGLGMSITKNLVGMMHGAISVSSIVGEGSSFSVELPFGISEENGGEPAIGEGTPEAAADKYDFGGARLLLAEDNEMNMEIASEILKSGGFSVDWAKNGEEAVRLFEESPAGYYSAILLDIQMPVMDGYGAARRIRASRHQGAASAVIIAMSANAFAEDVAASLAAGMNDHVAKPIDPAYLFRTLRKYIGGKAG